MRILLRPSGVLNRKGFSMWKWWVGVILIAISVVGCGPDDNEWVDDFNCEGGACDVWDISASVPAMCNVTVEGMGSFDVETQYLPESSPARTATRPRRRSEPKPSQPEPISSTTRDRSSKAASTSRSFHVRACPTPHRSPNDISTPSIPPLGSSSDMATRSSAPSTSLALSHRLRAASPSILIVTRWVRSTT